LSTETLALHGKSFYFAGQLLSKTQLQRAAALYASCRNVDDIADETPDKGLARAELQEIKTAIEVQNRLSHPVADAICETLKIKGQHAFLDLMEGVISDTGLVEVETEQELIKYCYRVAGTVGVMMCDVLDVSDTEALDFAVSLGVAMQLTNIARDVLEDAKMQRRYLPAEWLGQVTAADIAEGSEETRLAVKKATSNCLSLAEQYYQFAGLGLSYLPFRSRLAITVAARVYREIGVILKDSRDYDIWAGRVVVSLPRKLSIALIAIASNLLDPRFYRKNRPASSPVGLTHIRSQWTT